MRRNWVWRVRGCSSLNLYPHDVACDLSYSHNYYAIFLAASKDVGLTPFCLIKHRVLPVARLRQRTCGGATVPHAARLRASRAALTSIAVICRRLRAPACQRNCAPGCAKTIARAHRSGIRPRRHKCAVISNDRLYRRFPLAAHRPERGKVMLSNNGAPRLASRCPARDLPDLLPIVDGGCTTTDKRRDGAVRCS